MSPRVPDLDSMQLLLAVARTGSVAAAGRELGMTQQTASAKIRALERLVGARMLDRGARGSTLTASGVAVAEPAARVVAAAGEVDAAIARLRESGQDQCLIAASYTMVEYLLPCWLIELRARHGSAPARQASVQLMVGTADEAAEHVLSGAADIGFFEGPRLPAGLDHVVVARDELVVIAAPGHPWTRARAPITARRLAASALVVREPGSGSRAALELALARAAPGTPRATPMLELASTTAIRRAVMAGAAPGVISDLAVGEDLATGRLVRIVTEDRLDLRRELLAIWPTGPRPAGPAASLLAIAEQVGRVDGSDR